MRRIRILIFLTIIIAAISLNLLATSQSDMKYSKITSDIFTYLSDESNRQTVHSSAIALNYGKSSNACVYFVAEVLRRNNYALPNSTANTNQLLSLLEQDSWSKNTNYKNLKPGDVCFTNDYKGTHKGKPTHTFIFMGWVEEGSYDYAYICDNQAKDYADNIYHIRNIKNKDIKNGITKEAFSFFMRPTQKI